MQSVWVVLAIMGYLMVTCVLSVLAASRKRALDIHDHVRKCMDLRREFAIRKAAQKQAKA